MYPDTEHTSRVMDLIALANKLEASRDEWTTIAVQRGLELEELHEANGRLKVALKLIINERWTEREWVKDIARKALE